jgi:hypothetical protein
MSSTLNRTQIDPTEMPTLAPDVVLTRADFDVSKQEPDIKASPSAAKKGAAAASATVPPVDTTFRAASTSKGARPSLGRRLMRVVVGMILTACLAGAAVLWESRGEAARGIVAKWAPPFLLTLLSRPESPADDQQPAQPAVQDAAATAASAPSTPQGAGDNLASAAAGAAPDQAQLLQSMARDLADLRQQMEQMKAGIADLKTGQDQMAREVVRSSENRAPEPNIRPRASSAYPVSPPPGQPVALPARRPPPLPRPMQPRAAPVSPQAAAAQAAAAAAYVPRQAEPRAVAPPPPSTAAPPPTDLSAPPRPPAPLREQVP